MGMLADFGRHSEEFVGALAESFADRPVEMCFAGRLVRERVDESERRGPSRTASQGFVSSQINWADLTPSYRGVERGDSVVEECDAWCAPAVGRR